MPKKFGRKGNKEGSIYNTIQKIDRKEKQLLNNQELSFFQYILRF